MIVLPARAPLMSKKRQGFSLIEAAIVLGVIGLVIGGIWIAASSMMENYRVQGMTKDIFVIASNVQKLMSNADANTLAGAASIEFELAQAGGFPKNWETSVGIRDPYFGSMLNLQNYYAGATPYFVIGLYRIPRSICIKLVTAVSQSGYLAGSKETGGTWDQLATRPTLGVISVSAGLNNIVQFPITPSAAASGCDNTGVNGQNNIFMGFGYSRIN